MYWSLECICSHFLCSCDKARLCLSLRKSPPPYQSSLRCDQEFGRHLRLIRLTKGAGWGWGGSGGAGPTCPLLKIGRKKSLTLTSDTAVSDVSESENWNKTKKKKKKHVERKLRLWLVFFTKNSTKVALHNPCLLGLDFGLAVQNISFCALFPLPLRQPFYLIGGPLQTQGLYSLVLGLLCWLAGRTVRAVWYIKNIFFL